MSKLFNPSHYMSKGALEDLRSQLASQLRTLRGTLSPQIASLEAAIASGAAAQAGGFTASPEAIALGDNRAKLESVLNRVSDRKRNDDLVEALAEIDAAIAKGDGCVVCGAPSVNVEGGKPYCGSHGQYTSSEPPAKCWQCNAPATGVAFGKPFCAAPHRPAA